jgi:hypothetical protein
LGHRSNLYGWIGLLYNIVRLCQENRNEDKEGREAEARNEWYFSVHFPIAYVHDNRVYGFIRQQVAATLPIRQII